MYGLWAHVRNDEGQEQEQERTVTETGTRKTRNESKKGGNKKRASHLRTWAA